LSTDVVAQISSATKALEQAGFRLVASGLAHYLEHPEEAGADGCTIDAVQKMTMKLA
jgi:DNA-binding FrmR family transcriptional regulator